MKDGIERANELGPLWDAINQFADSPKLSTARMNAVARVENALDDLRALDAAKIVTLSLALSTFAGRATVDEMLRECEEIAAREAGGGA